MPKMCMKLKKMSGYLRYITNEHPNLRFYCQKIKLHVRKTCFRKLARKDPLDTQNLSKIGQDFQNSNFGN